MGKKWHVSEYSGPLNNAGAEDTNPTQSKSWVWLYSQSSVSTVLHPQIQSTMAHVVCVHWWGRTISTNNLWNQCNDLLSGKSWLRKRNSGFSLHDGKGGAILKLLYEQYRVGKWITVWCYQNTGFSLRKKGHTNMECGKARKNSVGLEWNWRYQDELIILKIILALLGERT